MSGEFVLTRQQVREVDRRAIEEVGIPGVVLMENAGRTAAGYIKDVLDESGGSSVLVVGGPGNNGGDGWVVARHLHNQGVAVTTCLCGGEDRLSEDGGINFRIVRAMGLEHLTVQSVEDVNRLREVLDASEVVVDGLLGTGFRGSVRPPIDAVIEAINGRGRGRVVSLDVPSGLDCETGQPAASTVRADLTVTFVAAKVGFESRAAKGFLGRVVVEDIGAPRALIGQVVGQG